MISSFFDREIIHKSSVNPMQRFSQDVSGMPTLCLPVEWGGFGRGLNCPRSRNWENDG